MTNTPESPTGTLDGITFTYEELDPADLVIYRPQGLNDDTPALQRGLNIVTATRITRNFQESLLGVFTVSRRSNGELVLLDGQHRTAAILTRRLEGLPAPKVVLCAVAEGLSEQDEAAIFLGLNDAAVVQQMDKFMVEVTANHETAKVISELAARHGWRIASARGEGHLHAVGALRRIYHLSVKVGCEPNLIDSTLQVVTDAWGYNPDAGRGALLEGVATMISHYDMVDLNHLATRLRGYDGGPNGLWTNAQMNAKIRGVRVIMSIAELVVESYNKGKRTGVLPTWTRRR